MFTALSPTIDCHLAPGALPREEHWWEGRIETISPTELAGDNGLVRARLAVSESFIEGDGRANAAYDEDSAHQLRIDGERDGARVALRFWLDTPSFRSTPFEIDATFNHDETRIEGIWRLGCPPACRSCAGKSGREGVIELHRVDELVQADGS